MERVYHYNNSVLKVCFDDIAETKSDVIVSTDNTMLTMKGGIGGMIRRNGGDSIYEEVRKFRPAELGDVIVTGAGHLTNKYIFHAVTQRRGMLSRTPNNRDEAYETHKFIIENSVNKCFRLLTTLGLKSIAFPAIGTGGARIPIDEAALHLAKTISSNILRTNQSLYVELFLFDRFHRKSEWDFLTYFEKLGKYWPEKYDNMVNEEARQQQTIDIITENNALSPYVFISYSRKDTEIAQSVCEKLKQHGIDYWIDSEGLYSGESFKSTIVDKITKSALVLFLSSVNSNNSDNVRKEISVAVKRSKHIIPIKLDDCAYHSDIEYDLSSIDFINYCRDDEFPPQIIDNIKQYLNLL